MSANRTSQLRALDAMIPPHHHTAHHMVCHCHAWPQCLRQDTLVSQACGAKQQQLAIHIFQRCRVIVALQLVWMLPLLWFAGDLLHMVGQDAEVASHTSSYTRVVVLGLFASMQFESIRKFLENRGEPVVPFIICGVASALHVGWCYLFIGQLRWGNAGAGCAQVSLASWCLRASRNGPKEPQRFGF